MKKLILWLAILLAPGIGYAQSYIPGVPSSNGYGVAGQCLISNGPFPTLPSFQTCTGGGGSTTIQVNGTAAATQSPINFENSTATNGLTLTFSNPSAGNIQLGLSGALTNAGLQFSSVNINGQSVALGNSADVNNGAPQYSIALNAGSSAAIGGIALPGSTGTYCVDYTSLTANPTLTACSGGPTLQTNGTNNASQTTLNIENGQGIKFTNGSGGNVQGNLVSINRSVSGSTDTISCTTDAAQTVYYTGTGTAVTLPQATSSCGPGFGFFVQNSGTGSVVVTPTTSTIGGAASLTIPAKQGAYIEADSSSGNYNVTGIAVSSLALDVGPSATFTGTGCTATGSGSSVGSVTLSSGCTAVTITFAAAMTAPNSLWVCDFADRTQQAAGSMYPHWGESSSTGTTAVMPIPAYAQTTTDMITYQCRGR